MIATPPTVTHVEGGNARRISISHSPDVARAQAISRRFAEAIGFSRKHQWEIATAVSEAATNILKYGQQGVIVLRAVEGHRKGLEFSAGDTGNGFEDVERDRQDGVTEGRDRGQVKDILALRGLGAGLGAIERLMDEVYLSNRTGGGASVLARKFLSGGAREPSAVKTHHSSSR